MWGMSDGLCAFVIALIAIVAYQIVFYLYELTKRSRFNLKNRHVFITGGSKGLGLSLAHQFAAEGAKVSIMARKEKDLQEAKEQIEASCTTTAETDLLPSVVTISADVTDEEAVKAGIERAEAENGPVFMLVACAGMAHTGYFSQLRTDQFMSSMTLNYMGVVHAVRAVTPSMTALGEGHILVVSSALALTGYVGYSAYAPTKFALRGLCEVLRNELKPVGIQLYSAYPPNMDTPGFVNENRTKPAECKAIEEGETLYTPDHCARSIIKGVKSGHFHIACGDLGIGLLTRITAGMSPRNNSLMDALMLPVLVVVGIVYRTMWDAEVGKSKWADLRRQNQSAAAASKD